MTTTFLTFIPSPRAHWEERAEQQKIVVQPHFPLDFASPTSIAVHVDGPSRVATPLAPIARLVVVQASRRAMRIQRTKTMASKQPAKQAESAAQADTGEANKPARDRERAPRLLIPPLFGAVAAAAHRLPVAGFVVQDIKPGGPVTARPVVVKPVAATRADNRRPSAHGWRR
jgi:hypothetical protein